MAIWKRNAPVPKKVKKKIYNGSLSIQDVLQYDLYEKIPITCIKESDRKLIERFGMQKLKDLDWSLFNNNPYLYYQIVMMLDPNSSNINLDFYWNTKDL